MAKIERIQAREILDSRGNPTVRAEIECAGGAVGVAAVPSGASTGTGEAYELRDGDEVRYAGKGVQKAVANIKGEIQLALAGKDAGKQAEIDQILKELDGTPNKQRLGANAILAVSLACARAEAQAEGLPLYLYLQRLIPGSKPALPVPLMNVINGGKHASNDLSAQEFQIIPLSASTFAEALRMGSEIYHVLGTLLNTAKVPIGVGDEGGYAGGKGAALATCEQALTYMLRAIEEAGYTPGVDVALGLDVAASELAADEGESYRLDGASHSSAALAEVYQTWLARYPIVSLEDPFAEEAWGDWQTFTQSVGGTCQVIGDDLFVTNPARIDKGIQQKAANAVLVKPNQIGTLTETLAAVSTSQRAGLNVIISHRSGETADTFIADLAVATGAGQIKTGAPARSERVEKYNRLLEIEDRLKLPYAQPLAAYTKHLKNQYQGSSGIVYT